MPKITTNHGSYQHVSQVNASEGAPNVQCLGDAMLVESRPTNGMPSPFMFLGTFKSLKSRSKASNTSLSYHKQHATRSGG